MANEITIVSTMSVSKGNLDASLSPAAQQIDMAGDLAEPGAQEIGTSEETLDKGDVGTEGHFMMRNMDDTNYVQWGFATGVYGGRMEAGETAGPFRLEPSANIYLKANTAACNIQFLLCED